jgi:hypothetical protein
MVNTPLPCIYNMLNMLFMHVYITFWLQVWRIRIRYYTHLSLPIDREHFNGVLSKLWSHPWSDQIRSDPLSQYLTRLLACLHHHHVCVFSFFLFFFLLMNSLRVQQQITIAMVGGSDNENGHKWCQMRHLCPGYVFFFLCVFHILTNNLSSI